MVGMLNVGCVLSSCRAVRVCVSAQETLDTLKRFMAAGHQALLSERKAKLKLQAEVARLEKQAKAQARQRGGSSPFGPPSARAQCACRACMDCRAAVG